MNDSALGQVMMCITCCVWPVVVWAGLNLALLAPWRRRVFGVFGGRRRQVDEI